MGKKGFHGLVKSNMPERAKNDNKRLEDFGVDGRMLKWILKK
jgi:hypothetical protein